MWLERPFNYGKKIKDIEANLCDYNTIIIEKFEVKKVEL